MFNRRNNPKRHLKAKPAKEYHKPIFNIMTFPQFLDNSKHEKYIYDVVEMY